MRLFISCIAIISALTINSLLGAEQKVKGHPAPLADELLSNPIALTNCPGVKVVEWRGSLGKNYTEPNKKAIDTMNRICEMSVKQFPIFVKSKGYKIETKKLFQTNISLLPWDAFDSSGKSWGPGDGDDYRSLQDNKWRFNNRFNKYDKVYEMLGWTDRNLNHVFVLNDISNIEKNHQDSKNIFAHELFHSMSLVYGLYDSISHEIDEIFADEFGKLIASQY